MPARSEFYKCDVCGRVVEANGGNGVLFCHGKPMIPMEFKGEGDEGFELHEPSIFEEGEGKIYVEIGIIPHEMMENSRIVWIEVVDLERGLRERKYLDSREPGASFDKPLSDFEIRLLCSKHGLWRFSFKQAGEDLINAIKRAVERFNFLRSPEAKAEMLELKNDLLKVEFTGNFCRTCGFYDYFEDLRLNIMGEGIDAETVEIDEFEDGAVVIYRLGGNVGDRGADKGDKQAEGK